MNFKNINLYPSRVKIIYIALILVYFILGTYLINQTSVTSDESAYIGAAYAYTQGLGLNQEHPLFLKLVASLIINIFFSDYQIVVPPINIISGEENREVRLAAFNLGYSFLIERPENFQKIIFILRFCYLFINSIFLLWIYFFTFYFSQIPISISIYLGILYVFSPSFYSHNFLISFDVSVSIYSLLSLWTTIIIIRQLKQFKNSGFKLIVYFVILNFVFFLAINAKFSNLILAPIIISAYLISLIYLFKKDKNFAIKFGALGFISLLIQPILIILMYRYAFRNLPNQSIIDNLQRYIQGIQMNLSTAGGIREPFWKENFTPMTSLEYLNKIFWFKENPAIFIIIILFISISIYQIIASHISAISMYKRLVDRQNRWQLYMFFLGTSYPLIYLSLTYNSRFIIGYRYFYPLIIFIYFGISCLTVFFTKKWQKYLLIGSFSLYIYFGLLGVSQSLSYVNPLWTLEKWRLADDSTINWGQETQHAVKYLLDNYLLPEINLDTIVYNTFGVNINFVQYLYLLSQERNYIIDIQSYYSYDRFNPETTDIAQLNAKYLLIDSTVKQQIISQIFYNPLAAKNWKFLAKNVPIYSRNDIIFIYQLR